ncbi:unnamed protein product [Parascedosporium putredinis]|uniref:PHP domain-like protein n=1 Tax=Parascedosporium putredinis TaxID=1442378 RepID=A0A9P1HB84_9PEZI|nr:unnamed protein product [Parascedosporium putredinis]CAI8003448.1 unnamed protein product [Parascedosporium putredinis]
MYDLNISWSASATPRDLECMLAYSSQLGYKTVALNHIVSTPIPAQIKNPLPQLPLSSSTAGTTTAAADTPAAPTLPTVLHRATILLSEPSQNHRLLSLAPHYHLLALRPTTEKSFAAACQSITDIPLISLDLSQRLPFHLRHKTCAVAVTRGLRFEISYAQLLAAPDARARANFIGNVMSLVRATRGKGLVISSGAGKPIDLRAPMDVVNLLSVWGLASEKGVEAMGPGPRGIIVNEGIKRSGYRGVIDIVKAAPAPPEEMKASREAATDGKGNGTNGSKPGGKDKKGQKRKNAQEPPSDGNRPGKKWKGGQKPK